MKKITYLLTGISLVALFSCGPSAEQKARAEKIKTDSVKAFTENQFYLKDSVKSQSEKLAFTEQEITNTKAELEVEKTKLNDAKGFKFLRTENEKDQEIKNIVTKIDETEKYLKMIYNNKDILEKNIAFFKQQIQ